MFFELCINENIDLLLEICMSTVHHLAMLIYRIMGVHYVRWSEDNVKTILCANANGCNEIHWCAKILTPLVIEHLVDSICVLLAITHESADHVGQQMSICK